MTKDEEEYLYEGAINPLSKWEEICCYYVRVYLERQGYEITIPKSGGGICNFFVIRKIGYYPFPYIVNLSGDTKEFSNLYEAFKEVKPILLSVPRVHKRFESNIIIKSMLKNITPNRLFMYGNNRSKYILSNVANMIDEINSTYGKKFLYVG